MTGAPQSSSVPQYFQVMSTAPPAPTPSKAAEPAQSQHGTPSQDTSDASRKHECKLPQPTVRLELRDLRHDATKVFLDNVNAATDIPNMVNTVNQILYYGRPDATFNEDGGSRPRPYNPHIPGTRSVTFVLRDMDGVAYTTGLELDGDHKEIHFSLSYIEGVAKRLSKSSRTVTARSAEPTTSQLPSDGDWISSSRAGVASNHEIRMELLGVICHELVHCFQWNAQGTAPGGLIEGVADFVRLRAGFVPPHWKREGGDRWDAGYQNTGYFLDWLEGRSGEGAVRRLNETMRDRRYEGQMWRNLFGESVETLWSEYCKSLKNGA